MKFRFKLFAFNIMAGLLMPTLISQPTTRLRPATLKGYERYVSHLEKEYERALERGEAGFWVERLDASARQEIKRGRILIEQIEDVPEIPKGIIHDWVGAVFIPDVKAADVIGLLTDYDRHKDIYPEAIESRTIERSADHVRGYLLLKKEKVLTVVLNTEHKAEFGRVSEKHWRVVSRSTKIREVKNAGSSTEKELPVGEDSGFLWRINAYWGILEEEEGVIVECSTVSLSRDIPWGLGWVIQPFLESMPRDTLERTLQATRFALVKLDSS